MAIAEQRPRFQPPPGACDCHFHVFGPLARFPYQPNRSFTPPEALVEHYIQLQSRLGLERCVVVQPSVYGMDNRCSEEAVRALGKNARGVAVLPGDVSEAEVERLDRLGFRGVRFNVLYKGGTPIDALEAMAARLRTFGWHIQLLVDVRTLPELAPRLRALPVPIVIDHMGYTSVSIGLDHPAFAVMDALLKEGRTWVKLSGAYAVTALGPPYDDVAPLARHLLAVAPERCVWGTDWPHPAVTGPMPDDVALLDLVPSWTTDPALQKKLFCDNAAELYGF
ncbi:MAG: amidohydrolase family protein [Alphaproteobacteria bacterium]|mgnify:CR=1 FL=1